MGEREEALRVGDDAAAAALRTGDRRRAGLGARAGARMAGGLDLGAHRHLNTLQRVLEGDVHLGLEIGAALRCKSCSLRPRCRRTAAASEEAAEEIAEIAQVEVLELRPAGAAHRAAAVRRAERVVGLALLGVGEDVVGALDLLEARLVAATRVRVMLPRELAVRLLDLLGRGVLGDAQRVVQIRHSGHDHPGGADHLVAEPVALLQHLQHRALLGTLARLGEQRLVDVRVEGAFRRDLGQSRGAPRAQSSERWTRRTPSSSFASSCSAAASSARSRSSSTGSNSFSSRSFARWLSSACSRAVRLR